MGVSLDFQLTQAGQLALWNAAHTGLELALSHVQLGSGARTPDGTELALVQPQQVAPIAQGALVQPQQVRMTAIFGGEASYVVREAGLWAGEPGSSTAVLVAYWSTPTGEIAAKAAGVDLVFAHDLAVQDAAAAGSLTIVTDPHHGAALAALAAHEAASNPHPQYMTQPQVQQQAQARVDAHTGASNPHPQYMTQPQVQQQAQARVDAHTGASNPHPQYMTQPQVQQLIDSTPAMPAGAIVFVAGVAAPAGYLKANGAQVSRTAYARLFAAIGTHYGAGDGSSTFHLPDLRGEFVRGWDDGRGVDVGRRLGTWQAQEIQRHSHTIGPCKTGGAGAMGIRDDSGGNRGSYATQETGGAESRPRNVALNACIKY